MLLAGPLPLQIINVDDSTVAFAQWGLGTMGPDDTAELPDTVVSKRSRHSVVPNLDAAGLPSAAKSPAPAAAALGPAAGASGGGIPLKLTPLPPSAARVTPHAAGLQAPAPTPATASRPSGSAGAAPPGLTLDPATLAGRLAEMAEQHDVTVEVPAVSSWDTWCIGWWRAGNRPPRWWREGRGHGGGRAENLPPACLG